MEVTVGPVSEKLGGNDRSAYQMLGMRYVQWHDNGPMQN
jgi:hypothetical protein